MWTNKILKVILAFLAIGYVFLQGKGLEYEAAGVSAVMLILLTVLYRIIIINRRKYFFMFLIVFTIAHVMNFLTWEGVGSNDTLTDYFYYITNILYITSYLFLIINIVIDLNLKIILSTLLTPIIILVVLDVFCVVVVSSTTEQALSSYQYSLELIYNAVVMILLSAALINYMYRNDNKSMLYLMASICILFSEIIQLAYYYILKENDLGVVYSSFLVIALLLFYVQSKLEFTGPIAAYSDERLEV